MFIVVTPRSLVTHGNVVVIHKVFIHYVPFPQQVLLYITTSLCSHGQHRRHSYILNFAHSCKGLLQFGIFVILYASMDLRQHDFGYTISQSLVHQLQPLNITHPYIDELSLNSVYPIKDILQGPNTASISQLCYVVYGKSGCHLWKLEWFSFLLFTRCRPHNWTYTRTDFRDANHNECIHVSIP